MQDAELISDLSVRREIIGFEQLLCPVIQGTSSQRANMFSSGLSQAVVIDGAEIPQVATGYESMFSDYRFDPTARDEDGTLYDVVYKYELEYGGDIKENPITYVFIKFADGVIDVFSIDEYIKLSNGFGFRNDISIDARYMQADSMEFIPKERKFTNNPSCINGMLSLGLNMNVAYMTLPHVTEDAFVISESAAKRLLSRGYETIRFTIPKDFIPLNLYGEDISPKIFPDIGNAVNNDGIIAALRKQEDKNFVDLMDTQNDVLLNTDMFIKAKPGAIVRDVNIYCAHMSYNKLSNNILFTQPMHYLQILNRQYRKVINCYNRAVDAGYTFTARANNFINQCMMLCKDKKYNGNCVLADNRTDIEQLLVEIVIEYDRKVDAGYKLTGRSGDKGVIAGGGVWPDDAMPVDEYGIRADLILSSETPLNRLTSNQLYESFYGRMGLLIGKQVKHDPGYQDINIAYEYIMEFLEDVRPVIAKKVREHTRGKEQQFVETVREHGVYYILHPFAKSVTIDQCMKIAKKYNYTETPVKFKVPISDTEWKDEISILPVPIGPKYMYLLAKIPYKQMNAIQASYISQLGVPSKLNGIDENSSRVEMKHTVGISPIRFGEDEFGILNMCVGSEETTRFMSLKATCQEAQEQLFKTLLTKQQPTALHAINMSTAEMIRNSRAVSVFVQMMGIVGYDVSDDSKGRG